MSMTSTSSAVDALLVRDVDGQYRPARAEEVLSQARRVLSQRVRRGATMSSPQAVKDHLRLEIDIIRGASDFDEAVERICFHDAPVRPSL